MARALLKERLENVSLVQRMGAVQPELLEKDEIIKSLEDERTQKSQSEMEKLRASDGGGSGVDTRAKQRPGAPTSTCCEGSRISPGSSYVHSTAKNKPTIQKISSMSRKRSVSLIWKNLG